MIIKYIKICLFFLLVQLSSCAKDRIGVLNEDDPDLNNSVFGDKIFEKYCVEHFDVNNDGEISREEALLAESINCSGKGIRSLKGIEQFKNLKELNVSNNKLSSLNLYSNISINKLDCTNNLLKEIRLSRKPHVLMCDASSAVIYKKLSKPIFTIIDDDFSLNYVGKLKAMCDELDIKCDFALIPSMMDGELCFTNEQLNKINSWKNEGFEFLLHPIHNNWYNDANNNNYKFIDVEHCETSLLETINLFETEGLSEGLTCIVYPGNAYEPGIRDMCAQYTLMGFGTTGYYNEDLSKPYDMQRLMMRFNTWGKEKTKEIIREGVKKNAWIVIGMHSWQYTDENIIDDSTFSWANLREILEYAKSLGEFKKYSEVMEIFGDE